VKKNTSNLPGGTKYYKNRSNFPEKKRTPRKNTILARTAPIFKEKKHLVYVAQ